MTREPLMLTDTAMLLLHRSHELVEYRLAFEDDLMYQGLSAKSTARSDAWQWWHDTHRAQSQIIQIDHALMRDIHALWICHDICPVRFLDWHLILDSNLMALLEVTFVVPRTWLTSMAFMDALKKAYQDALDARMSLGKAGV